MTHFQGSALLGSELETVVILKLIEDKKSLFNGKLWSKNVKLKECEKCKKMSHH